MGDTNDGHRIEKLHVTRLFLKDYVYLTLEGKFVPLPAMPSQLPGQICTLLHSLHGISQGNLSHPCFSLLHVYSCGHNLQQTVSPSAADFAVRASAIYSSLTGIIIKICYICNVVNALGMYM